MEIEGHRANNKEFGLKYVQYHRIGNSLGNKRMARLEEELNLSPILNEK